MSRYYVKPPAPVFNPRSPLALGCVAFWPFSEGGGDAVDIVRGVRMAPQTSAVRATGEYGPSGNCVGNQVGFSVLTPEHLRLGWPMTVACSVRYVGTPSISTNILGITHNNTDSDPYLSFVIFINFGGNFAIYGNSGGSFFADSSAIGPTVGVVHNLVASVTPAARRLWIDGVLRSHVVGSTSNPTYTATSRVSAGFYGGVTRNSNLRFHGGGIWNREWTHSDVMAFQLDPFSVCRGPQSNMTRIFRSGAALASRLPFLRRMYA